MENSEKYDLIFQDSTKKDYGDMIEDCYLRLNPEGLLIVDNIFFNGKIFGLEAEQIKKYHSYQIYIQDTSEHSYFSSESTDVSWKL